MLTVAIFESMALYKRVEFAQKCGIDRAAVSVNIGRKKIIVGDDDRIDDTNEINKKFFEQCMARRKNESDGDGPKKNVDDGAGPQKNHTPKEKSTASVRESHSNEEKNSLFRKNFDVDIQKKEAEIRKKEVDQQLTEMKLKKLSGRLIDREAAWNLFTQQMKFFSKAFHDGVEGLLTEIVKKSNINRNVHAEMRAELIKMINNSVDRAVDDGKKHFSSLIQNEVK